MPIKVSTFCPNCHKQLNLGSYTDGCFSMLHSCENCDTWLCTEIVNYRVKYTKIEKSREMSKNYTNDIREFQLETHRRVEQLNQIPDLNQKLSTAKKYEAEMKEIRKSNPDWIADGLVARISVIVLDTQHALDHYNQNNKK